tara:strand:- start:22 stop:237 length:216 start_codon:yes stop_codon:yes gene_type:complete
MQSKKQSFVEAVINVFIGYLVAVMTNILVLPMFGVVIPLWDNLLIGGIFTIISIIRSYVIRRMFNGKNRQV